MLLTAVPLAWVFGAARSCPLVKLERVAATTTAVPLAFLKKGVFPESKKLKAEASLVVR
jgi:hypothetical protein